MSTYAEINKRRDLLLDYGPYGQPALLVKNIPPFSVTLKSFDGVEDDAHDGHQAHRRPILDPTATGYLTLRQWMSNGATENNTGVPPPPTSRLPCSDVVPPADPRAASIRTPTRRTPTTSSS